MQRYELWKSESGYDFFPDDNKVARDLLSDDAELIWSLEADDWEDAQIRKHEFLGWEPYKPIKE